MLPGGVSQVRERQATLQARLDHLYAVQGIDSRFQDTNLEDPFDAAASASDATDVKVKDEEIEDVVQRIKLEDPSPEDEKKIIAPETSPTRVGAGLLSSSPTSPSNGFQRSWQRYIVSPGHTLPDIAGF